MFQLITPELITNVISFFIELVVATFAFYLAGRLLSGVNAKFTDAFFVALFGLLLQLGIDIGIGFVLDPSFNPMVVVAWNLVGFLGTFIVWMILVQHFFDTAFLRGLLIIFIGFILVLALDVGLSYVFGLFLPTP